MGSNRSIKSKENNPNNFTSKVDENVKVRLIKTSANTESRKKEEDSGEKGTTSQLQLAKRVKVDSLVPGSQKSADTVVTSTFLATTSNQLDAKYKRSSI